MGIMRKQGAGFVAVANVVRRQGAGWTPVQTIYRRQGGAWVLAWQALKVTGTPLRFTEFVPEPAPAQRVMAAQPSPTVAGATTYTVQWAHIAGTALTVSSLTALRPTFSYTVRKNSEVSSTYRCTVTANGLSAHYDLAITFSYMTDV